MCVILTLPSVPCILSLIFPPIIASVMPDSSLPPSPFYLPLSSLLLTTASPLRFITSQSSFSLPHSHTAFPFATPFLSSYPFILPTVLASNVCLLPAQVVHPISSDLYSLKNCNVCVCVRLLNLRRGRRDTVTAWGGGEGLKD